MGRGSYKASDWAKLRSEKGMNARTTEKQLFAGRSAEKIYDSRFVRLRESRDSEDSPTATPIMIAFDVTGSMGYLAKELAVNALNKAVMTLLTERPISDPHILCAAVGDCRNDKYPFQATQFEADIRIIRQLLGLYLEGGGGGNGGESYHLAWYFAAYHTAHDHYDKRGKKGFLFTIGDDACHDELRISEIRNVFADNVPYSVSNAELLAEAGKRYHVIHIHIERNRDADEEIWAGWQRMLPGRCTVIHEKDIDCLAELICAIISVLSGKAVNETLKGMDQERAEKIARSMATIRRQTAARKVISF